MRASTNPDNDPLYRRPKAWLKAKEAQWRSPTGEHYFRMASRLNWRRLPGEDVEYAERLAEEILSMCGIRGYKRSELGGPIALSVLDEKQLLLIFVGVLREEWEQGRLAPPETAEAFVEMAQMLTETYRRESGLLKHLIWLNGQRKIAEAN